MLAEVFGWVVRKDFLWRMNIRDVREWNGVHVEQLGRQGGDGLSVEKRVVVLPLRENRESKVVL